MSSTPIKHYSPLGISKLAMSATYCNRVVDTVNTVDDPRKATCKTCLTAVTKEQKREMCAGCEDNFYNGNNPYSVKECWHLAKAKIVCKKQVGMSDVPPWKTQPIVTILSCRHEKGYIFVDPKKEY